MEQKKQFLGFEKADEEILKELRDVVAQNADRIVDAFYDHLMKFDETRAFLTDPNTVTRLKGLQKQYLVSLVSGEYGEDYHLSRRRIGQTHQRIKLQPQYYLGTYALYFGLLYPLVLKKFERDPEKRRRAVMALIKIINLDSQIAIDTYIDAYHQQLESANEQLESVNQQLEDRLQERIKQLNIFEQKLGRVERLALIGTLASGIAHDVGTPLNIISGRVEILTARAKADERMQKDLIIINEQIDRITRTIRNLLTAAKQKEGTFAPVDLDQLLHTVVEFLRIPLEKARVVATISVKPDAKTVQGDKDQLQQLFLNLMMNAIQAMPGSGKLTLRTEKVLRESVPYVAVDVEDTGIGIKKTDLEKIFDPFFSTKPEFEGTGLGLAIAQDIVKKHGGHISVQSEVNRGTIFRVLLPLSS